MKLKLTIDGKTYEVDVEATDPDDRRPAHPAGSGGSSPRAPAAPQIATPRSSADVPAADESKVCRSPVAGVVVRVSAQAGQEIQAHDVLLVLEAMKMETSITAPVAGKVARVNVAVGDAVQGGQILVEFD